jgi:transcription initiation factor TFIID TATA-box-binding protein
MTNPLDTIEIQNIVATSGIGREIELGAIEEDIPNAKYNPSYFSGLIYRNKEIKPVCMIFRSGKIVCTGASDNTEVTQAFDIVFEDFRGLDISISEAPEITVNNLVSSANLGTEINLNSLAIGLGLENMEYEPEQFPGLVYRIKEPSVVMLLFSSGKVVVTGAKRLSEVKSGISNIMKKIQHLGLFDWSENYEYR